MHVYIEPAEIKFIQEIVSSNPSDVEGKKVKIAGKVSSYNPVKSIALIEDRRHEMKVSTTNLEPFQFSIIHHQVQCIGDLTFVDSELLLVGRHIRCVDGLNMDLYEQTVKAQRQFLNDVNKLGFISHNDTDVPV